MAAIQLKTFKDIVDAVREELKIQASDTVTIPRIKRDINIIYLNEVIPQERWKWLRGKIDLNQQAAFEDSNVTVTQGSRIVTLTTAPTDSKEGYLFSLANRSEIYRIAKHTAGSTTVELESDYVESTSSSASVQIWTDAIPLPSDCRETVQVYTDLDSRPLEHDGLQMFRNKVLLGPKEEGRPRTYTTTDYVDPDRYSVVSGAPAITDRGSEGLIKTLTFAADPSSFYEVGDHIEVSGATIKTYNGRYVVSSVDSSGNTITYTGTVPLKEATTADGGISIELQNVPGNSERYREMLIHPSINDKQTTIHIDYIKEAAPMEADNDEPLLPIEDRVILLYGALVRAWSRERNPEEANRNAVLYTNKLASMQGKLDDSTDYVRLQVNKTYLSTKRNRSKYVFAH